MSLVSPIVLATSMLLSADPSGDTDTTSLQLDSAEIVAQLDRLIAEQDSVAATFTYLTGKIDLGNGAATLDLPESFKFLDAEQSKRAIVDLWGNPPSVAKGVLGMIMPAEATVLNKRFAFVVEYLEDGYVSDEDADDIDYDAMMTDMKAADEENSKARRAQGSTGLIHIGWAAKPFYDKEHKVLHWAFELRAEDEDYNTLNYNVRVLGRKGVLVLNALSSIDELPAVQENIPAVLAMATFNDGHKYEQFDSDVDNVAAYTLGGLVAAKVLAKAGLFAGLLKFIAPFMKGILIGLAALGGLLVKFFTGRNKNASPPAPPASQPPAIS